jgi:NAD(P)-dependent dehydrogenase (short-subunit alcohol dehydrogenase family)
MRGGLEGRVALVTGATSGIGEQVARALLERGARVYVHGRDAARAAAAVGRLRRAVPHADAPVLLADLSSFGGARSLATAFLATGDPLHLLVNNAGLIGGLRRAETVDGAELTIAVNHLAPFVLTSVLRPTLEASAPARVVTVASGAYKDVKGPFDFDDYYGHRRYSPFRQYALSKLANVLFTRELARRTDGSGVTANAATPPRLTGTRFAHNVHPGARVALTLWRPFSLAPARGAAGVVHVAASEELAGRSGEFWSGMRRLPLDEAVFGDADARRLWELSARLVGASADPPDGGS